MNRNIVVFAIATLAAACTQVDTGHRGVQTRFGEVDMKLGSMPEGLYFYNTFTSSIIEMDTRLLTKQMESNTYTKDVQQADIKYTINFRLNPDQAHVVFKEVGTAWTGTLVYPAVEGILKQVIGHYAAVDLIEHRAKATAEIQEAIKASLKDKHVDFVRIELTNIQYHKAFEQAVEAKVVAVQRAVEEQNRTVQVREQAAQQIISAQAQAESMKIRANALTQNAKLVEYEAVQKWDGKLPTQMFGNTIPFVNVGK